MQQLNDVHKGECRRADQVVSRRTLSVVVVGLWALVALIGGVALAERPHIESPELTVDGCTCQVEVMLPDNNPTIIHSNGGTGATATSKFEYRSKCEGNPTKICMWQGNPSEVCVGEVILILVNEDGTYENLGYPHDANWHEVPGLFDGQPVGATVSFASIRIVCCNCVSQVDLNKNYIMVP